MQNLSMENLPVRHLSRRTIYHVYICCWSKSKPPKTLRNQRKCSRGWSPVSQFRIRTENFKFSSVRYFLVQGRGWTQPQLAGRDRVHRGLTVGVLAEFLVLGCLVVLFNNGCVVAQYQKILLWFTVESSHRAWDYISNNVNIITNILFLKLCNFLIHDYCHKMVRTKHKNSLTYVG